MGSRAVFLLSRLFLISLVVFGLGMLAVQKDWPVARKTAEIQGIVRSLIQTGKILPDLTYIRRAPGAQSTRYEVQDAAAIAPGTLAITRLDADTKRYVIDLIGTDGTVQHSWPVDYARIAPDDPQWLPPHGTKVLPDGSVLVSFDDGEALARLDACGKPLWTRTDSTYHHVIQQGDDGYWTWNSLGGDTGQNQKMFRFDVATGDELEAIDLVDDVIATSRANALAAAIPEGYRFNRKALDTEVTDLFHPNDVEPLPAAIADAFPQFNAGDLLISLRDFNLVGVIDRQTRDFKWAMYGPWIEQHDPDWQADGTITVFNNNSNRFKSNILRIDPKTRTTTALFPDGMGPQFFTIIMGNHQQLENGNWLIVSALEGRVIETTAEGALVREYANVLNADFNAVVLNAEYLPETYFTTFPTCSQ